MTRLLLLVTALAALLGQAPGARAADVVPGEIIVRFESNAEGSDRAAARRAARVELKRSMRLAGTQLVGTAPGQDSADALAALRRDPRVRHAVRNAVFRRTATPNDPELGSLWGLHNTGSPINGDLGVADADIDAPEAWDLFNSAPDTVVAVVDSGVEMDHPDLDDNLWSHEDGSHGWDFVDGDADPADVDSHGTHVAGTIAAEGNNGIGITGVAWDAQIMAVRVLDETGQGDGQAVADGLVFAAENGARVVNASLGSASDDPADKAFYDDLFDDYPETLFVVAAGNDKADNDAVPYLPCNSSAPNVVCVAATNNRDELAPDFSNYGQVSVDLAAPGQSILSTVSVLDGNYDFFNGTSMAAPHVSGVATLLFGARSDADVADVRGWLLGTGDPLPALSSTTVTGRRLNAAKALVAAGVGAPVITGGVVDVGQTGATLLGTLNPGGTDTSYKFVYGIPGATGAETLPAFAGNGTAGVAVSAPIIGLDPDTTYEYRLVAIQNGVETAGLVRSFKTAGAPAKLPPSLTIDPATAVGDTSATLSGSVDPNGKPSTVVLEFGRASGSYTSSTSELAVEFPSTVSVDLTNLTPGTTYFYRLRAGNADGESTSPELSFTTTGTPPAALPPAGSPGAVAPPVTPPPGIAPQVRPSVICKLNRRTRKPVCRAGATAALKVSVLIMRGSKVFSRGRAGSLTRGKALRMRTPRRMKKGRYTLRITASHNGAIVTTLKKTIRL